MLPFFFRHYDKIVDRYVMYDDDSTDETLSILKSRPNVEVRRFPRINSDSFAFSELVLSNHCWKESRGQADWVIVTDVDEHLFHPSMREYLYLCKECEITTIPALGFQMLSDYLPEPHERLHDRHTVGAPAGSMMKCSIFDPDRIHEINFEIGKHRAAPSGQVIAPKINVLKLLHYNFLGFDRTFARHRELLSFLGPDDLKYGWGSHYSWSKSQLKSQWETVRRLAMDVSDIKSTAYPIEPWWHNFERSEVSADIYDGARPPLSRQLHLVEEFADALHR